jgi:hypothetical protein
VIVKTNLVTNDPTGVSQTFKAVAVCALVFECPVDTLDHSVLLWNVGRVELLSQSIAFDQGRVAAAGKNQPSVGSKQHRLAHPAQASVATDQGLL